jgi:anti-anti-sigma factor
VDELAPDEQPRISVDVAAEAPEAVTVTIRGELDISAVDSLDARVARALDSKPERLIVDISGLRFADSSAIALWVRWSTVVHDFELRGPSPFLRRVIAGMGLTEKLAVEP